jgi:hypothetical protein
MKSGKGVVPIVSPCCRSKSLNWITLQDVMRVYDQPAVGKINESGNYACEIHT